jgi:LuxR family maltose regulon positive regulatory protein
VINAQAGWGKTTLLSAWASSPAEPRPFAWLSLDPGDDDPVRFWRYVVEALRTVVPGAGAGALELLAVPGSDLTGEVLPLLLNDLAARDEPLVLALDDFHLVGDPAVHAGLAFFVEHLPAGTEVAVASRSEPALGLGRLRARGELLEIDETLLRFSEAEGAALLNEVAALGLDPEAVAALYRRTEGWAAGLYLAALSLRDRDDPARFIDAFSGDDRHVVDYLGAEVLAALDAGTRRFLLCTSVLERLTGPLCDAVTGTGEGARTLREIERSNLFVVPLDGGHGVYRYHHLFGDLLRRELDLAHPGLAPELHRRAFQQLLVDGDVDGAIRHAIAAGDERAAVELIAEHWPSWLMGRGEHAAIDRWLRALPEEVVREDPRLGVAMTFTGHSLGRARAVAPWLDAAEARVDASSPARIRVDVAVARASNALQTGDIARALSAAARAFAVGERDSPWISIAYGVRAHGMRWSGRTAEALAAFTDWLRESELRGQLLGIVHSHGSIALIHAEEGRRSPALHSAQTALARAEDGFAEHWVAVDAHAALARVHDGERSRAHALKAVELADRGGVPGCRANALLHAASLADPAAAADLVARARELLAPCRDPGALVLDRLAAAERRLAGAADEGDELSDRELTILRLLATELSQREIGDELYVSVNTVKTHARHIFRKLGATSRDDAVRRARSAGVL